MEPLILECRIGKPEELAGVYHQQLKSNALMIRCDETFEREQALTVQIKLLTMRKTYNLEATVVYLMDDHQYGLAITSPLNDLLSAIEALIKGVDKPPTENIVVSTTIKNMQVDAARKTVEEAKEREAMKSFTKARELIAAGRLKAALPLVQEAIKKNPTAQAYKQVLRELRKKIR